MGNDLDVESGFVESTFWQSLVRGEFYFESHLLPYSKPRGYRSRQLVTHEDRSLSCTVTGVDLASAYAFIILNTVAAVVYKRIDFTWSPCSSCTGEKC